jgi:hypothetical protein
LINDFFLYRHAWRYNLAPDQEPNLSTAQCRELLKNGGWMVRNTYDFDQVEKSDFWYVIKDCFGGMEELSSNVRRKVRKALQHYEYKPALEQEVRDNYPIIKATFDNYKIKDRDMNESVFNSYLDECCKNKFDYWGIFNIESNKLIGFCTVHVWDNSCEYGMTAIWPEFLRNGTYPYYGLYYTLNEYYLDNRRFKYVTDSARSVTEHSNIQPFLEQNFNFRKAYCKLRMTYKWWFGIIVKMMYPFRSIVPSRNVRAVLKMHEFRTTS